MARVESTMKLHLGTVVPDFTLPSANDHGTITLSTERKKHPVFKGAMIVFTCNHCPFAKHVADRLSALADEYLVKGMRFYAISSNDISSHPEDSPTEMRKESELRGFHFPYLYDEDQSIALAYHAACTPDFYVVDEALKLCYRGRMDATTPNDQGIAATGVDLKEAMDAVLEGKTLTETPKPSIGCNIKWKPENAPTA